MTTPSAAAVARIESGMLDTCEIRQPGTESYDPDTVTSTPTEGSLVHTGLACEVSEVGTAGRDLFRGGDPEIQDPYQVTVPRDTDPAPQPGQIVKLTAIHTGGDTTLIGKPLLIRRVRYGTRMARRILLCDLLEATTGS